MMRLSFVLDNMQKVVRDLSRNLGKPCSLKITGSDLEADKRILDHLKEPLIHLLRNSIDHGIESPDTRGALGKNQEGQIEIDARRLGAGSLEITVKDDGAGLNLAQITTTAVQRGILTQDQSRSLSERDVRELIFHPQLSTKQIVTEISGLGVGMAAVRKVIEQLGGRVDVDSQPDVGTEFRMTVPTTVSTTRGLIVEVKKALFLVPSNSIAKVDKLVPAEIFEIDGMCAIDRLSSVVPVTSMAQVLRITNYFPKLDNSRYVELLIFKLSQGYVAVTVDRVVGEQEVVIKSLTKPFINVRNIQGMTLLASGDMIPVLSISDLVESSLSLLRAPVAASAEDAAATKLRPSILIADDAITSRMLFRNILASQGYDVRIATDGEAALEMLRNHHFDLVLSDIQMPKLDGLQLTRKIRQHEALRSIPVILISSLGSREEIQRGADAGADAYFVKSRFDQESLLDTVRRLI
jgi:two-component system chemotaxis sensor kinase CheA